MCCRSQRGKINVKVLVILIVVIAAIGTSLFAARQVRRSILSNSALAAGNAAFENKDWAAAGKNLREYLGRNPDDVEIVKKYAETCLSVRPLTGPNIAAAIAAYRHVLRLAPLDKAAYDRLAMLYASIGNFEELAYVARARIEVVPDDREAPLWLANALVRLDKTDEAKQTLDGLIKKLETLAEKPVEYVRACTQMSLIIGSGSSPQSRSEVLGWLNKAVDCGGPNSVEALVYRGRFYRETPDIPGVDAKDKSMLARKDLETAGSLGTADPRIRLFLGAEWMAHGEMDRARAELQAAGKATPETLAKQFVDLDSWKVSTFLFAAELAMRGRAAAEGASLADEALAALQERGHRIRILPAAVRLYLMADKVTKARECLDEYTSGQYTKEAAAESKVELAYVQALVARAENRPYAVIGALQPVALTDASRPDVWRLLAEAYDRTDQTRRAVNALIQYLRSQPRDADMTTQLARDYLKLRDWTRALEIARLAESLNPTEIVPKLLRIEASIHAQTEPRQSIDKAKLEALRAELIPWRRDYPNRVDIRLLQAAIANSLGQPDVAESELKSALAECKEPLRAEMELVRLYHGLKRTADAVSVCQAACKRHAEVAETWLSLSSLLAANGDYDSARSSLKEGLDAVAGRWEKRSISMTLALLDLMHGDRATGIRLLSDLAAQDDSEVLARSLLLSTREIQRDPTAAGKLVNELKNAEGESGLLWRTHRASLLLSSNEWRSKQQDIVDLLRYGIDSDPEWSSPVLLLVQMYEKLNDDARVEDTCRQALVRNPSAAEVADKLVGLLQKQGRLSDAEKVLEQVQTGPGVTSAWHVRMALRAGDFSRAIDELKVRVSNDERDADSRILLARLVYGQTKDAAQAFKYLKEAEAVASGSMALTAAKVSILKAEGQTEEAKRSLDDHVRNRGDFAAYMMRASYLADEGEFERAEQDYRKLTTFTDKAATGFELLSSFYARSQKLDQAVAAVQEGLNAYPTDLGLKRRLMKLLLQRAQGQDREKGVQILAELEEQLPQDPEIMKIRVLQMMEKPTPESLKTVIEKLETVVRLEPAGVDTHLVLIDIAMQQGRYEAARDYAVRASGPNPNNLALLLARGKAELALANSSMAFQLTRLALQQAPDNWDALDLLVEAAFRGGDRNLQEEARTLTESALGRDPKNERLLLSRSRVLVFLGRPQMAIPEMEVYCRTEKGAGSIPALLMLAEAYRLAGDAGHSKQRIDQAQQLAPDSQAVIHARFLWLVSQKRFEELPQIVSAYLSAKDQNPQTVIAAASILVAQDSTSLKKEGVRLFEHAVALSPTLTNARLGLASSLYQSGDAEGAEKSYRAFLAQYPDDTRALNDLAWILQEHYRRYADALELANRGLKLAPGDAHLLDTRGTILSNLPDRLADAKTDFETLLRSIPSSDARQQARTLAQLGRICTKLNDTAQAKKYLENALEIDKKANVLTPAERSEIAEILKGSGQ